MHANRPELMLAPGHRKSGSPLWGIVGASAATLVLALCFAIPFGGYVPKEELVKTSLWALAFFGASAGWGTEIARLCWPGERVGFSLRTAWGASAFAFFGGVCAMASVLSKALILVWMVAGAALVARSWIANRDRLGHELHARLRATRLNLPLAGVVLFLAIVVLFSFLGGASSTASNPYDDDVSYYPFAKQLLQRGTLIDPFSFRRMSTLGGQALYHAALLVRVQPLHLNVFDRGICFVLAVGLLASHRPFGGKKATVIARLISVAFLVVLPNTGINSASYYSGLAFFLAFFQTLERLPESEFLRPRSAARRLLPLALTGAALCTLRQNYQAVVATVLLASYVLAVVRVRKAARWSVVLEGAVCFVLVGVLVAPWLVLLYRSNDTLLFPVMKGTFRAGVEVQSREMTTLRYARLFADVWLHPDPIFTLPLFFLVGLFVKERSLRRPVAAQWLGGFVSLLALCVAFSLSDAGNLARYAYGFVTASALLTWQSVATRAAIAPRTNALSFAAPVAILVFALSATLIAPENRGLTKKMILGSLRDTDEMLRRTVPAQAEPPVAAVYRGLQQAVPAGARVLIMLDEPYLLDYARNEIWSLDMPGTASPAPGIPCFQGPEAVAQYLLAKGIRHLLFVTPERSTYLYKRDVWRAHVYDNEEIWRVYAPYLVDVMDNLVALAATRVHLRDESGMTVLDLEQRK